MPKAYFRFYAELNDLLPSDRRQVRFAHRFELSASVKDMIESLGVPHTEVDLILANGESVGLAYPVQDDDWISVYPVFESLDIESLVAVRPVPLRQTRFVLDTHLGKLATYLRMLGFDARYANDSRDEALAEISREEERILLTRDRGLLKRSAVTHGYCVRSDDPKRQLVEVLRRFDLWRSIAPLRRCLRCNALLDPVPKSEILDQIPPGTRLFYDTFSRCPQCRRVYWQGSHYERMKAFADQIMAEGVNVPGDASQGVS